MLPLSSKGVCMKRNITFPVFLESTFVLVTFLLIVNLASIGGFNNTYQEEVMQPQMTQDQEVIAAFQ